MVDAAVVADATKVADADEYNEAIATGDAISMVISCCYYYTSLAL